MRKKSYQRLPIKILFIQSVQNGKNYRSTKDSRDLCGKGEEKANWNDAVFFFWGGGGSEGVIKCSKFILLLVSHCHKDTKITELCNYSSKLLKCPERFQVWAVEMAKKVKVFATHLGFNPQNPC